MSDNQIKEEEMETYSERIRAISNTWAYNHGQSASEIFRRMIDHAKRGWLSREWVDGAYGAILAGKHLEFAYNPKEKTSIYLAGSNPEVVRDTLLKMKKDGFEIQARKQQ